MSTAELKRAQRDTVTREFLPKPRVKKRSAGGGGGAGAGGGVAVKPLCSEDAVCGYVFDTLDVDGTGILKVSDLTTQLTAPSLNNVVNSSATLSLMVRGHARLLELLAELYPGEAGEDGGTGAGGISKHEFVEFCSVAGDMNLYDDYSQQPPPQAEH
jgi:hypothetical protein